MKSFAGIVAISSSALLLLTGCAMGASESTPSEPAPTRGAANSKLLGSRICFTSSYTSFDFRQPGGSWEAVSPGEEKCVSGFASSSIPRTSDNGATSMWVDVRADIRFLSGTEVSFYADNPAISFPSVGWTTAPAEAGWKNALFNSGVSQWVNIADLGFTVERRSDSADDKEFLVKI